MIKVAIIYGGSKTGGGVDTYLTNLFEHTDKKEVQLELISLDDWPIIKQFQVSNFKFRVYKGKWWNLVNVFGITSYLKKNGFSLIVSSGMVANFYARMASIVSGIPNVVTVHSDWRTDYQGLKKIIYLFSDRLLRFRTKEYIAVSGYLKERLVAEGVGADKVEVIYNGLNSGQFLITNEEFLTGKEEKLGISNSSLRVGSAGRLHPVKNYGELILAIGDLVKGGIDVSLEIAGDGAERKRLQRIIKENGLIERVKLLGWQKDLGKLRHAWDIYAQPSQTEGFGLAVVEAMREGLPVVVTPGGALPELVVDGQTGIVATGFGRQELTKAIEKLIAEPKKMQKMAEAGQQFAAGNFGIERWVKSTLEVYKKATQ